MVAKGRRINSVHYPISCLVRTQIDSMKPYIREAIPFVIEDTVSPKGILKGIFELRKLINDIRPDIIHAQYGSTTALISLLAAYQKGVPLVISFCGSDLIDVPESHIIKRLRSKIVIIVSRFCAHYARAIIVKSANLFDQLPKVAQAKTRILPNGVDLARFQTMPKLEARKLLSWDPESFIILFNNGSVSNAVNKNLKLAKATFLILKARIDNAVFKQIGEVPHEEMPIYLNAADVLSVTSLSEGSPNIVKEAMACNLPIVTVKCGDVSERLRNVYPSYVVDSYDAELLSNAVIDIFKSNSRSNGRQEIEKQKLDIVSIGEGLAKIYTTVINKK